MQRNERVAAGEGDAERGGWWARWGWDVVIGLVLVAGVVGVFRGVVGHDFVPFDDDVEILYNAHLQPLSAANVGWMLTDTGQAQRYTPLSWLAWGLLEKGWGVDPAAFHAEAVAVHAIDAVLVYLLLLAVLRRLPFIRGKGKGGEIPGGVGLKVVAGIGAAWWGFHPLRLEVVAWAAQVRFAESAIFAILCVLCYLRAVDPLGERGLVPGRGTMGRGWFWLAVGEFAIALLFYPYVVGLPLVLLLIDWYPLERVAGVGVGRWRCWGRLVLQKWPFWLCAAMVSGAALVARYSTSEVYDAPVPLTVFDLPHRVMQAFYIFAYYLWKPVDFGHILPIYVTLVQFSPWSWPFVASAVGVVAATAGCAWLAWRGRWKGVVVLWFSNLLLLFPMGGYFDYPHYPSDRYSYLQGILPVLTILGLVSWQWRRLGRLARGAVIAVGLAVPVVFAGVAMAHVPLWKNGESLFRYLLAYVGDNPYRDDLYWRLGEVYLHQGRVTEALELFDKTLAGRAPAKATVLRLRGAGLLQLAEYGAGHGAPAAEVRAFYGEAGDCFRESAQIDLRANSFYSAAYAYARDGRQDEALENLRLAVRRMPEHLPFRLRLGAYLYQVGRTGEARQVLEEAIGQSPSLEGQREEVLRKWDSGEESWQPVR